jgi:hypothetical protein
VYSWDYHFYVQMVHVGSHYSRFSHFADSLVPKECSFIAEDMPDGLMVLFVSHRNCKQKP